MPAARTELDARRQTATVRLQGDIVIPTAQQVYDQLRGVARRRDVRTVVVDFTEAGQVDSSAIAVVALAARLMARGGKAFELAHLSAFARRCRCSRARSDCPPARCSTMPR
jgi:anti-anti-sigma factor